MSDFNTIQSARELVGVIEACACEHSGKSALGCRGCLVSWIQHRDQQVAAELSELEAIARGADLEPSGTTVEWKLPIYACGELAERLAAMIARLRKT